MLKMNRKLEIVDDTYYFLNLFVLILDYLVGFLHLPFDRISNRPIIDVFGSIYGILNVNM